MDQCQAENIKQELKVFVDYLEEIYVVAGRNQRIVEYNKYKNLHTRSLRLLSRKRIDFSGVSRSVCTDRRCTLMQELNGVHLDKNRRVCKGSHENAKTVITSHNNQYVPLIIHTDLQKFISILCETRDVIVTLLVLLKNISQHVLGYSDITTTIERTDQYEYFYKSLGRLYKKKEKEFQCATKIYLREKLIGCCNTLKYIKPHLPIDLFDESFLLWCTLRMLSLLDIIDLSDKHLKIVTNEQDGKKMLEMVRVKHIQEKHMRKHVIILDE